MSAVGALSPKLIDPPPASVGGADTGADTAAGAGAGALPKRSAPGTSLLPPALSEKLSGASLLCVKGSYDASAAGGAAGVGLGGMPRAGVLRERRGCWHRGDLFGDRNEKKMKKRQNKGKGWQRHLL